MKSPPVQNEAVIMSKQKKLPLSFRKTKKKETFLLSLYEDNKRLLYATALSILGDEYQAEEALQELFLRMDHFWTRLADLEAKKIRSYLVVMLKNQCFQMLAQEKRNAAKTEAAGGEQAVKPATVPGPEQLIINRENISVMLAAVRALDPAERELLILRYYYGYSGKAIAKQLRISHAAARMRLSRAKTKVKEIIGKEMSRENEKE